MKNKEEKTIEELKKEWQKKHGEGNCRELVCDGKSVFVYDPTTDFNKIKIIFAANKKSNAAMVDALLNNCWLGGDESLKKDESFKMGIEDQVMEMIDILEPEKEKLENGNVRISVAGHSIEVRPVDRMDMAYAESRNPESKALMTGVHILEKIAINKDELDELRKNAKAYVAVVLDVYELKNKKYVEVKKF